MQKHLLNLIAVGAAPVLTERTHGIHAGFHEGAREGILEGTH